MSLSDGFMIVSNPVVSVLIWIAVLSVLMYFARMPAHRVIISLSRVLHYALRLSANSLMHAEQKLAIRNKEVLLAAGREATERIIEREFERIEASVRRDMAELPSLNRKLGDELELIDKDYRQSADTSLSPLGWTKAVEEVAKIPAKSDPMVGTILEGIHESLVKAHKKAEEEHRKTSQKRHKLLQGLTPQLRKVQNMLAQVDKHVNSLLDRSKQVGRYMHDYEDILKKTDHAMRLLSSSALNQFFISAFVLAVAIGGAVINFNLIARPMAEMVGGTSMIGSFKAANIAALVIILVEISMGLFLMESLRITRLFPVIGALKDTVRIRMAWITFSILLTLASVEAGLAYMREILMQDELATSALLRGEDGSGLESTFLWITTAAQMGMGFILPFALVFVAIPLETFVHSMRTVVGIAGVSFLRGLAFLLRLLGNVFRYTGNMLLHIYDLFIFAPLWLERIVKSRAVKPSTPTETTQANAKTA